MNLSALTAFGRRYAKAWSSGDPERVASFYEEDGTLIVNDGKPAKGRQAIAEVARSFMTTFPDMHVGMKGLVREPRGPVFHWSLTGTNTGPGGKGHRVSIEGYEVWRLSDDEKIAESRGHFDAEQYAHQLEHGVELVRDEDEPPTFTKQSRLRRG